MVNYTSILENLPPELQLTLLKLAEAMEQNLREQLAPQREEVVDLRAVANGLLESQQSSLQRMDRLETVLVQLAQAQQRTEQRVEEVAEAQRDLAQAQQRTEARMEELAQAQRELTQAQRDLVQAQQRTEQALTQLALTVTEMQPRLVRVDGWRLERRYIERAASYFGRWLRQPTVVWPGQLAHNFEQQSDTNLSAKEKDEVLRLDAIIRGKTRPPAGADDVYVVLEASVTIYDNDVDRVRERATLLRRCGLRVIPVVAGERIDHAAEEAAKAGAVAILLNGKHQGWDEALAAA